MHLAFAQTRNVSGKVTDEQGSAVPLASVLIKGTNQGTVADQNGTFILKVKAGDVLIISSQGFSPVEITVNRSIFICDSRSQKIK